MGTFGYLPQLGGARILGSYLPVPTGASRPSSPPALIGDLPLEIAIFGSEEATIKFSAAQKTEILAHIRAGMRPGAAAELIGFTRDQMFDLLDEDEEFAAEVRLAEREATEHVEEALYQAAVSGNVTAARIWLERRDPPKKSTALVHVPAGSEEPDFDAEVAELNRIARGEG